MNQAPIPKHCDVVVVGGGPAGSSAATLLALEGFEVVLLEKARHPRPNVGEAIIPHIWRFLDLMEVTEKIDEEGFLPKAGGIVAWDDKIHQISFSEYGYQERSGLHVERDRFDYLLLRHAAECGVQVCEEVLVQRVDFVAGKSPLIRYEDRRGGSRQRGAVSAQYVVDASGYHSLLARQFNARRMVGSEGKYLGLWGYYAGSRYPGADWKSHEIEQAREVMPVTLVVSYEGGWAWHIALRESTSVGLILETRQARGRGKEAQESYFRRTCREIPYISKLLEPASFVEGSMAFRPDYSYYSERIWGEGFFCIGDAAAFVDPIFSHGATAAVYNGALASWAIAASLKKTRRREFYGKVFERQLLQNYGFSRLLAFGDFGGEGIDSELVQSFLRVMPQDELDLSLAASMTTKRSGNFRKIVKAAGVLGDFSDEASKAQRVPGLDL